MSHTMQAWCTYTILCLVIGLSVFLVVNCVFMLMLQLFMVTSELKLSRCNHFEKPFGVLILTHKKV
jgi:hypothetical protein